MSKEQCCLVCEALMGRLREERCRRREGIFRVPGNAEKIAEAQARLRNFEDPDIVIEDLESEEDFCDACASLLRKWLPMAIEDAESSDADRMFEFLATIADDADYNKMTAANLATVFAASFCKEPTTKTDLSDAAAYANFVAQTLAPMMSLFQRRIIDCQANNFKETHVDLRTSFYREDSARNTSVVLNHVKWADHDRHKDDDESPKKRPPLPQDDSFSEKDNSAHSSSLCDISLCGVCRLEDSPSSSSAA